MTTLKLGSLFSGYGGLDIGVTAAFARLGVEVETAWHVEFDEAPSKILAHHWPTVPNYGDITAVDFSAVEQVDIITGGFPCQDLSLAGRRAGMRPGTRSGLWADFLRGIATIRPRFAVIENVRGLLSGCAESNLEPCPGCVGDGEHRPPLRALGRVLGDLADIGYDARWVGVRAADAGAPHGRFRVFVLAYPAVRHSGHDAGRPEHGLEPALAGRWAGEPGTFTDADSQGYSGWFGDGNDVSAGGGAGRLEPHSGRGASADAEDYGHEWPGSARNGGPGSADDSGSAADSDRVGWHGGGEADSWGPVRAPASRDQSTVADTAGGGRDRWAQEPVGSSRERVASAGAGGVAWGLYEPAIRRWEAVTGRPAPAPTRPDGRDGKHRLNPELVEWMMGLPAGHVTAPEIGLTRSEQLKACGNGVVPQQADYALALLFATGVESLGVAA